MATIPEIEEPLLSQVAEQRAPAPAPEPEPAPETDILTATAERLAPPAPDTTQADEQEAAAALDAALDHDLTVRAIDTARLGYLMESSFGKADRGARVASIMEQTGLGQEEVENSVDVLSAAVEAAKFDPAVFRAQRPEFTKFLLQNMPAAETLLQDPAVKKLDDDLRKGDLVEMPEYGKLVEVLGNVGMMAKQALVAAANTALEQTAANVAVSELERGKTTAEDALRRADEAKARAQEFNAATVKNMQWRTPKMVVREVGDLDKSPTVQAAKNAWHSANARRAGARRLNAAAIMLTTNDFGAFQQAEADELAARIEATSERQAIDNTYIPGTGLGADFASLTVSSLPSLGTNVAGGLATMGARKLAAKLVPGGAALQAFVGAAGVAVTRSAAAAVEANEMAGGMFNDLSDALPDAPLEERVALSVAFGAAAAGVSVAPGVFNLKALGPIGDAILAGDGKLLATALTPSLRRAFANAGRAVLKDTAGEVGEEIGQDILEKGFKHFYDKKVSGATTPEEWRTIFASADEEAQFSFSEAETAVTVASGMAPGGGLKGAVNIATSYRRAKAQARDEKRVAGIMEALGSSAIAQAPKAAEKTIEAVTKDAIGRGVNAFYVDAAALQQKAAAAGVSLDELMGAKAGDRVAKALATTGMLEVPLSEWAATWQQSPLAEQLKADISTGALLQTKNQKVAEEKAVEDEAKRIVADAKAGKPVVARTAKEAAFIAKLERQLADAPVNGKLPPPEAVAGAVAQEVARLRTTASRWSLSIDEVLDLAPTNVTSVREADFVAQQARAKGVSAGVLGLRHAFDVLTGGQTDLTQAPDLHRAMFLDPNTKLYNERGWDLRPAKGKYVIEYDLEGKKLENDVLGHLTLDGDLREMANVLVEDGAVGAKMGSSLFEEAGSDLATAEKLARDKAAEMSRRLGGLRVTVKVTERQKTGKQQADVSAAAQREYRKKEVDEGRLAHRKGIPVAYARPGDPKINYDWDAHDKAKQDPALGASLESPEYKALKARYKVDRAEHAKTIARVKAAADFEITPEMAKSLEGKDPVQIANELFVEPGTGLITQAGWDFLAHVLPPADSYVSADMRELKFLNDLVKNGEAVDRVMHMLGRAMAAASEMGIVVSHLHGDEYGARLLPGVDPKVMVAFKGMLDDLGAEVRAYYPRDGVEGSKPYGLVVVDGVEIAADIGKTFAKADDALNESKAPASQVKKVPALETFATKEERDARIQELQGQRRPNGTAVWVDFSQPLPELAAPGVLHREDGPAVGDAGNGLDTPQEARVSGALEERRLDGWSMAPQGWFMALEDSTNKAADEIALVVEQSDLSTFIHESGHRYLKLLDRLSRRYDTPPAVEKDIDTLLAHLGAKSLGSLTREQQEKFARSSEQYVMEGKAPSVALQPVFKRFKGWLKRIYRKVGKLVDLSDEVRGVFDRIYATDGEIARAREKAGQGTDMLHALGDLVAEGMLTQAEVDRYYKDRAAAEGVAAKAGRLRELKDELRQRNKDIAEAKAEWRAEAEAEYDALPQVRAEAFIRTGVLKGEDGTVLENVPGATLDRAAVESMLGEAAAPLRPYLSKLHAADTVEPGVHPDDLAERAGYNGTGAELLKAILNLVPREEYVRDIVQAHLDYESDLLEARDQVAAEVAKGLHGYETLEWMHTEWRALAGRGKAEVGRIKLAAIERAAEILADEQTLSSVRPHHALQAERTAADAAMAAAAAGNYGLAMVHQERRMLNAALYRKLLEAKQLKDTLDERAKRLSTDSARAKLGKADLAFRDAADEILETLGYSKPREREVPLRGQAALLAAFEKFGFTVIYDTAVVDRLLAARKSWRMLTVAEAREVDRALRQISKTAGNVAGVQLKGQRISLQDALARLAQAAKENHPKDRAEPASSKGAASLRQKAADTLSGIDGELLQMATLVDMLGGYEVDSVWRELLFNPLQKAKQREYDLVNSTVKPIVELLRKMPPGVKRRLREKVDGKKLFPQHTDDATAPTRRFELLTIALNAGNESNLERLLQGRNISPDQLQAAIDLLTEEEMAWVQSVWDANEKLWPLSADLEERQSGLRPKAIVATPVIWRGQKTFRGGYYPAIYDRRFGGNNTGEKQALDSGIFDQGFTRPGTNQNHLKKRAEHFNDVIDLDFRHLSAHVVQVAHDVAFREALSQAARIVLHKDFQGLVKRKLGDKKAALFLQWLKDIGHARAAQPDTGARTLTNGLRVLRSNFAVATLGYAADIAAGDLTNTLVAAADKVGAGHLAKAGMQTGMSPVQMRAFALQKSGELRFRQEGLARELRNQLDRMTAKNAISAGPLAWWKEHAFALQEAIDAATATPVWIGAYNQGLADAAQRKGFVGEEAEQYAIDFADDIVRRSFPSHSPVDQSAIMRDRGFAGTMLLFHGYFNLIYQRDREDIFRIVRAWEDGATAESLIAGMKAAGKVTARASGRMLGRALAVFVLGNFLSGRGPAAGEPPEEWLARSLLLERLMLLPFGDVAVASIESVAKGKRANVRAAPGLAALYEVGDTLLELGREKSSTSKKVAAAAKLAAMFAGIPGTRPIRGAQFVFDLVTDPKTSAKDPFDAGSQLVYGPDGKYKKADPLGVISSALP